MGAIHREEKSLKKSFVIVAVAVVVLLGIGLFFQFGFTSFTVFAKDEVVYIKPPNCPEQICNTDSLRTWVNDIGIGLNMYNSNSVVTPLAIVFKGDNAFVINTASKRALSNDLCVLINSSNACKTFEDGIKKTDIVTLNFFTSLFSVNDIRLKQIAINIKQVLNDSVNVIPRFILISNIDDPNAKNVAEVQEVARQLCILQMQPNNWVQYVACLDNALLNNQWTQTTWQGCAQAANIDANAVDACIQDRGTQLLVNEQNTVRQLKLTSAPVLFINNDAYASQFTFDTVKRTVCMYFNKKPEGCQQS